MISLATRSPIPRDDMRSAGSADFKSGDVRVEVGQTLACDRESFRPLVAVFLFVVPLLRQSRRFGTERLPTVRPCRAGVAVTAPIEPVPTHRAGAGQIGQCRPLR